MTLIACRIGKYVGHALYMILAQDAVFLITKQNKTKQKTSSIKLLDIKST